MTKHHPQSLEDTALAIFVVMFFGYVAIALWQAATEPTDGPRRDSSADNTKTDDQCG